MLGRQEKGIEVLIDVFSRAARRLWETSRRRDVAVSDGNLSIVEAVTMLLLHYKLSLKHST